MPKLCHVCGEMVLDTPACPTCFPRLGRGVPETIGDVLEREADRLRRETGDGGEDLENRRRTEREGG